MAASTGRTLCLIAQSVCCSECTCINTTNQISSSSNYIPGYYVHVLIILIQPIKLHVPVSIQLMIIIYSHYGTYPQGKVSCLCQFQSDSNIPGGKDQQCCQRYRSSPGGRCNRLQHLCGSCRSMSCRAGEWMNRWGSNDQWGICLPLFHLLTQVFTE